jgi:hypothetical protein
LKTARGIGRATADALQKAGLRVLRLDLHGEIAYDLTDLAGIPKLIDSLGEIHVLVNNAGVQNAVSIEKYTEEQRERILRIRADPAYQSGGAGRADLRGVEADDRPARRAHRQPRLDCRLRVEKGVRTLFRKKGPDPFVP